MSIAYFAKQIEIAEEEISYYQDLVERPSATTKIHLAHFNIYRNLYNQFVSSYSMGMPIEQFAGLLTEMVKSLVDFRRSAPASERLFFNGEVDEYMTALALISWGVMLPLPQSLFDQLIALLDGEGQRDGILDILIAVRDPTRVRSTNLIYPKLYQSLFDATKEPVNNERIGDFLARWYETCLKRTSSYAIHLRHGGEDSGFTGYWAWEVAGLTHALGINDSSYRSMPYYPADLVAYAR